MTTHRIPEIVVAAVVAIAAAAPASAAPEFVQRRLTMPRGDFALDLGLGLGHIDTPAPENGQTGLGMNLGAAIGITWNVELGFRTGFRMTDHAGGTGAAEYGRMFDTETYGVDGSRVANPELRLTWQVAGSDLASLGLQWRLYLPTEDGSVFGFMFAMPFHLHLGRIARLDSGFYVPVFPNDNGAHPDVMLSIPFHLWIQVSHRMWLGPLSGVKLVHDRDTQVPLGFGLGIQLASAADFKTWFLIPDVNHDAGARNFGIGFGLQLRIE